MRISGRGAFSAVEALAGGLPSPRRASLRALVHDGQHLDRALLLIFPGPGTVTGEDLAELHLHGGRAVVRAVETALASMPGLRAAEPGEFTRRALTNGRIGLTEAEGLADLLAAETESQRRAASRAAEGGIRQMIDAWAKRTLQLSAAVEAMLDHADEDDVDGQGDPAALVGSRAADLAAEMAEMAAMAGVERLRDGIRVVLAGPPNAGKSTLLNALAEREAAIVSPLAGTTRDRIEAPVMRDGIAYLLIDTAGLHDAPSDMVEEIGIDRALQSVRDADILLWLGDAAPEEVGVATSELIPVHGRCDVRGTDPTRLNVSARTGEGIGLLWRRIAEVASTLLPPADRVAFNQRQRDLLHRASIDLHAAATEKDLLLTAEHLRSALRSLDAITGAANVEAMLDELFGRFCIGK